MTKKNMIAIVNGAKEPSGIIDEILRDALGDLEDLRDELRYRKQIDGYRWVTLLGTIDAMGRLIEHRHVLVH